MIFEFYPNSNSVGNNAYMKNNGIYVDYDMFMNTYIPIIVDNYNDPL